jgi:hypothetical protein
MMLNMGKKFDELRTTQKGMSKKGENESVGSRA